MLVTITFEKEGKKYKVERGRKPKRNEIFYWWSRTRIIYVTTDSRKTQDQTNDWYDLRMSQTSCCTEHIHTTLALHHSEQQDIIEQLLGIQLLT